MDYNQHNINQLLDKYWDGTSSLDEERMLKQYFKFGNVHPSHSSFIGMFEIETTQGPSLSNEFDQTILNSIGVNKTKIVSIARGNWWKYLAAACAIALVSTVAYRITEPVDPVDVVADNGHNIPVSIASNPEAVQAWTDTRNALISLSSKMNKGQKETLHFSKFNQAQVAIKGE